MESFRKDNFSDISEKEDDHESSHSKSPTLNKGRSRKASLSKLMVSKVKKSSQNAAAPTPSQQAGPRATPS